MPHRKSEGAPCTPTAPTECPTPESTSAMLAKEMYGLSVEEREKVLEDVHGIARASVDEPLDCVRNSLVLLEQELSKISTRNKVAFDLAKIQSKEYVSSEKLRLMFLRADSFDAYKAAARMVRFFNEKYELFGADKLTTDIVLADLDPDDTTVLEKGFCQVLAEKDCAGRKVFCFFPNKLKPTQSLMRAYYYTLMKSVEDDEEGQKRGVVGCVYCVGRGLDMDLQVVRKAANLRTALPARFDSVHACYNDLLMLPFISLGLFMMETYSRMRFRAHYGSDEECRYQLSSFGIPISAFPVSPRGEFHLENQRTFMARQRTIEAKLSPRVPQKAKKKPEEEARYRQPIIEEEDIAVVAAPQPNLNDDPTQYGGLMSFINFSVLPLPRTSFVNPWWKVFGAPNLPVTPPSHIAGPTMSAGPPPAKLGRFPAKPYVIHDPSPNDILMGRGKPIQQRPGNVRFRDRLDKHMGWYEQGERGTKVKVSAYILHLVKEEGGRFLKELECGGWVEIDDAEARTKVSHAFRGRRGVLQATLKTDKRTA